MCVGTSYDYDYTQKQVNRTPKWVPSNSFDRFDPNTSRWWNTLEVPSDPNPVLYRP